MIYLFVELGKTNATVATVTGVSSPFRNKVLATFDGRVLFRDRHKLFLYRDPIELASISPYHVPVRRRNI